MSTESVNTGARVAFRLSDAVCPEFEQVVAQIGPELEVAGEVVLFSDRGSDKNFFAIVQVEGLAAPLIVPVGCLNGRIVARNDDVGLSKQGGLGKQSGLSKQGSLRKQGDIGLNGQDDIARRA